MTFQLAELPIFLLLGGILLVSLVCRRAAGIVGQPQVVGEILAGLAVGLLLAHSAATGDAAAAGSTRSLSRSISLLGDFGLVFMVVNALFQDHVGKALTVTRDRTVLVVTAANIVPAALCAAWLGFNYADSHAIESKSAFVLLIGVAASISAVPVLARMLDELKLAGTRIGSLSFRAACWTDMLAWVAVAVALSLHGKGDPLTAGSTRLAAAAALIVALLGIRALMRKRLARSPQAASQVLLVTVLLSAGITHLAGLHLVFGAFLVGTVFASERELVRQWLAQTTWLAERLLSPLFFVVSGMNLATAGSIAVAEAGWGAAFLAICVVTKLVPLFITGRALGYSRQDSSLLAVLLNTRGLMELVILSVGLNAGIFSPVQYSIFVMVAIITTVISMPLCRMVMRRDPDAKLSGAVQHP
ncbi:hypothetical protein BH09PSE5_BH09PSE5_50430 [soil metagenome]